MFIISSSTRWYFSMPQRILYNIRIVRLCVVVPYVPTEYWSKFITKSNHSRFSICTYLQNRLISFFKLILSFCRFRRNSPTSAQLNIAAAQTITFNSSLNDWITYTDNTLLTLDLVRPPVQTSRISARSGLNYNNI